jgi:hypothetical protein
LANEDYELNTRIHQSGGRVYLDPEIRCVYFARENLSRLSKQYWNYGNWKWRMLMRYPSSLKWRQVIPPVFVLSLITLILLSIPLSIFRFLLLGEILIYMTALLISAVKMATDRKEATLIAGIPLAIATMHLSWGSGFIYSMIRSIFTR